MAQPDEAPAQEPVPARPAPEVAERPRDLIRRYVLRELGSIDAWEAVLTREGRRLYAQMVEDRRALLAIQLVMDHLEAREAKATKGGNKR